jgi:hypothetical protein
MNVIQTDLFRMGIRFVLEVIMYFTPNRYNLFGVISEWQKERALINEHLDTVGDGIFEDADLSSDQEPRSHKSNKDGISPAE